MLKQIQKKSDKTYLVSADDDTWVEKSKDATNLTPSEFNQEKTKLLNRYTENDLISKLSRRRGTKFTDEDRQILIQEIEFLKTTNKFAKVNRKK